jgi:bifunctional non-homologous end joining protein LigD
MPAARGRLTEYERKRDFDRTPEPSGDAPAPEVRPGAARRFVVQKHAAGRLHYDLRLELDGAFKSWAVPKGPSLDPEVRALAVHVEDHPLDYGSFEGTIPKEEYGGGTVMLWDRGEWHPRGDPHDGYERGRLRFRLEGERLGGGWILVRMGGRAGDGGKNWLLQKLDDDAARSDDDERVTESHLTSVATGRSMDEIADESDEEGPSSAPPDAPLPAAPEEAPEARIPEALAPQLPTLVSQAPEGDEWLHELKFDGYRILARIENGEVRLRTRRGQDWSGRFPTVARAVGKLGADFTVLDGEIAVLAADGTTDFQALQNQLSRGEANEVGYFVFDLLFYRGRDLRKRPLHERKRLLRELLELRSGSRVLRYSDHIVGRGPRVAKHACRHSLEGIVAKRADARYREGRGRDWIKVKCLERQEFVVGGWTDPSGSRKGFGALLLGWYDDEGRLTYSGRVGTGFTADSLSEIRDRLDEIATDEAPFHEPPSGAEAHGVHWTTPDLVAEVAFSGWTEDGRLRHPSFQGLREDKPPGEVTRETPRKRGSSGKGQRRRKKKEKSVNPSPNRIAGVHLSNPGRVLYPEQGITKRDLAAYYESVESWIVPHVRGRPLSLVRCPRGREGKCFYQKHLTEGIPEPVRGVEVAEADGSGLYVAVDDLAGLVTLVQFGVLEFHPWGSREDRLDRPDRFVYDLDPGEGVGWSAVTEAARLLGDLLEDVGLESFLRTTGGKGLHVVVPIARRSSWDEVKGFARGVARRMEREDRDRFVSTASKAKRKGRIYVDYLRNGRGATAIASYSTRARPGAPVATPIRWDELAGLAEPDTYTVQNLPSRLRSLGSDPWDGFVDKRQVLTRNMTSRFQGSG